MLRLTPLVGLLALAPRPGLAAPTQPAPEAASSPLPRGSAFEIPTADRDDPYGPRPQGVPRLTREQVVRFSLENPLVKAAEARIESMKAQLRKARFAWIPEINTMTRLAPGTDVSCDDVTLLTADGEPFDFQHCRTRNDVDIQTIKGWFSQLRRAGVFFSFNADTVIPLYTFGKWKHTKNAAKAGVLIRKLERVQARHETVVRVQQAWATLLLARESIRILEEGWDIAKKARSRVEQDLGGAAEDFAADPSAGNPDRDPDDLFRVELAEIRLEQQMREARKIESLSLSALWALAGKAAPPGFDVAAEDLDVDAVEGGLRELADYKEMAALQRPEAKMASAAIELRRAQEKLARANFLPDLGIAVSAGYAVSSSADDAMNRLYYRDGFNYSRFAAVLAMRWKWDFHNKTFDLQKARADLRAAEYQRQAALLLLGRDVEEAYAEVVEATHRMDLYRRAGATSWKLVVSQEQRDTVGGGDSNELVRALEKWYEWRFRYFEAIMAHNVAVARLSRAVGTPLATDAPQRLRKHRGGVESPAKRN